MPAESDEGHVLPSEPHQPPPPGDTQAHPESLHGYHRPPHGGQTGALESGYVEVIATRSGDFVLYIFDRDFRVSPPANTIAVVHVGRQGYPDVVLRQEGDHLEGRGPPLAVKSVRVFVTLHEREQTQTAVLTVYPFDGQRVRGDRERADG